MTFRMCERFPGLESHCLKAGGMRFALKAVFFAMTLAVPSGLEAQVTPERRAPEFPAPRPGVIAGIVVDTLGTPIEDVDILIPALQRGTRSDSNGIFELLQLADGVHEVHVRRLGYRPYVWHAVLGPEGALFRVILVPTTVTLPPMLVASVRTGLSGMIRDSGSSPFPGATVYAVGRARRTTADSSGTFHLPLRPGSYMIQIGGDGHETRLQSVTLPRDSGRYVDVWLGARLPGERRRTAAMLDMRFRMTRRSPMHSAILSREDILKRANAGLDAIATGAGLGRVRPECEAVINGEPFTLPLWALETSDVEFLEVYAQPPPRAQVRSIDPRQGRDGLVRHLPSQAERAASRIPGCPEIYVWLRR